MAPRELPILLGLVLGVNGCLLSRAMTIVPKPGAVALLGVSRMWPAAVGMALLAVFVGGAVARRRQLVAQGLIDSGVAVAGDYRSNERVAARARDNERTFRARARWAVGWLSLCLLATLVHEVPPFWSVWLAAIATAGALIFVRFGDGAEWALVLPVVAALAYAVSGNPLVGVPQVVLFVPCWLVARWEERRDPSAGWLPQGGAF